MNAEIVGTKGKANLIERKDGLWIEPHGQPEKRYVFTGEDNDIYQTEHDEMFAAVRQGEPINNGRYMAHSTLLAILGRMTTYTGQEITWEQALNSQERLGPTEYDWEAPLAEPPVSKPGESKFA
jgi:hypothetical protein